MDPRAAEQRLLGERDRLERLREVLEADGLGSETESESVGEITSVSPADLGTETFEREKEFSMLEEIEAELLEIEAALARVASGAYGRCEVCREAIPDERLEVVPAARRCRHHQDMAETLGGLPR